MFSKKVLEEYLGGTEKYQWDWWRCTWEVRWKVESVFVTPMAVNENGSSLPNSLQRKLVFKKVFNKDIEMS